MDRAEEELGGLDILVNNAGLTTAKDFFFLITEQELDRLYAINLRGQYFCAQQAARCSSGRDEHLDHVRAVIPQQLEAVLQSFEG